YVLETRCEDGVTDRTDEFNTMTFNRLSIHQAGQNIQQIMGCCNPCEIDIESPKDPKLRGLMAISLLSAKDNILQYRVACVLGIEKSHIWRCDIDKSTKKA